jgi:hypothetical protein
MGHLRQPAVDHHVTLPAQDEDVLAGMIIEVPVLVVPIDARGAAFFARTEGIATPRTSSLPVGGR